MPIRSFFNQAVKVWKKPYNMPFLIGWGVVFAGAAMIPISEEDKKGSPVYRRYVIQKEEH
eukprot:CAMPEP_0197514900 /NCGR_PEP_ID=MMETSP1318-20131121/198_1 /TAXON_ID=552666 /ORGANISM="Partenskyella glossopodia, Strain RCC365" /LENGTH=59 /DNA_ID=CAMNT_0043063119 /DNA_START=84 /DNA_END=263 /DNA_ORIENTATION=+